LADSLDVRLIFPFTVHTPFWHTASNIARGFCEVQLQSFWAFATHPPCLVRVSVQTHRYLSCWRNQLSRTGLENECQPKSHPLSRSAAFERDLQLENSLKSWSPPNTSN
jgi:hypothetical protein